MSYVKNNWNEGDVITAEKLNNIENGIFEINGLGELAVGGFQNGDILTLQTADNKTRKMKYTEVEIGIQYVEDDTVGLDNLPDLVGTEEDLSILQKLLNLNSNVISREIKNIFTGDETEGAIFPFNFSQKQTIPQGTLYNGGITLIQGDVLGAYVFSLLNNKGMISYQGTTKPGVYGSFSIVVKGFLPIE